MSLRIRFQYLTGATLGYSIERLSDGTFWDFASSGGTAGTFTANPTTLIQPLPEDTVNFVGRYKATLASTPGAQFTDGTYAVTIHNTVASNQVAAELSVVMHGGDDAPVFPSGAGGDPWGTPLPGSYGAGTAGAILGGRLDAQVSSRLAGSAYTAPDNSDIAALVASVGTGLHSELDAVKTQTDKLTFTGSNINTNVQVNADKTGYSLGSSGLDAIVVETGVNARQALSPILAAAAGVLSGAGTGTVIIKGGNVNTTRIIASTDSNGNRTSVTLSLPS
jgi:hypothetical protein